MLTDEQHDWLVSTLKINVRVAASSETTEDGKLMRKRGEKYKDEEKKAGWYVDQQHKEGETEEERDRLNREREMNYRVTDMYTDEKRDEKTVVPDKRGVLSTRMIIRNPASSSIPWAKTARWFLARMATGSFVTSTRAT